MKSNNPRDFREVWTHDGVKAIVKDILDKYGSKIGAKIQVHRYESSSPHGTIKVAIEKYGSFQTIRYGLPDDREELRKITLATLEPTKEWKSRHRREY